jgi:hypothetical protein
MSLRRVKLIYCVAVVSIAVILASTGLLGVVTAVLLLAGALPMFRAMRWAVTRSINEEAETTNIYVSTLHEERRHRQALQVNDDHTPPTRHIFEDRL